MSLLTAQSPRRNSFCGILVALSLLLTTLQLGRPVAASTSSAKRAVTNDGLNVEASAISIDNSQDFVRQNYRDFLNREPDASGLAFWTNEIEQCGADAACREVKRINVSAAFFLSIEFKETGFLVYRLYKASFGRMPRLAEFITDGGAIGKNIVVGSTGWQQQVEANKAAFILDWTSRYYFKRAYPTSMPPAAYVDTLFQNAGVTPSATERNSLVSGLGTGAETRETVLRKVAENQSFVSAESNKAFVLMQYFGYLRRNPEDLPDADLSGFNFWLGKLNQFHGNFIQAEMVKAFLSADEYRKRFDQPLILTKRNATPGESVQISGSGFNPSLPTTVTFTDGNGYTVKTSPVEISATSIEVEVPVYVNTVTGTAGAGSVVVSVQQSGSGQTTNLGSTESLKIRDLPQLSSSPGLVTLEALAQINKLSKDAGDTWKRIEGYSQGNVSATPLVTSLMQSQDKLQKVRDAIQQLSGGQVQKVSLGTVNGRELFLDKNSLMTLDRIYYALLLDGAPRRSGSSASTAAKSGGALTSNAADDSDVSQDIDNASMFSLNDVKTAVTNVATSIIKAAAPLGVIIGTAGLVMEGAAVGGLLGALLVGTALVAGAIALTVTASGAMIENRSSSQASFNAQADIIAGYPSQISSGGTYLSGYQPSTDGQNLMGAENSAFDVAQQFNDGNPSSLAAQTENAFSSLGSVGSVLGGINFGNVLLGAYSPVSGGGIGYAPCDNCVTITIKSVRVVGPDSDEFHIAADGCTGFSTSGGGSCRVDVFFLPTRLGPAQAYLQLNDGRIWLNDLKGSGALP